MLDDTKDFIICTFTYLLQRLANHSQNLTRPIYNCTLGLLYLFKTYFELDSL